MSRNLIQPQGAHDDPRLNTIDILVSDMDPAIALYARLGLNFKGGAARRLEMPGSHERARQAIDARMFRPRSVAVHHEEGASPA